MNKHNNELRCCGAVLLMPSLLFERKIAGRGAVPQSVPQVSPHFFTAAPQFYRSFLPQHRSSHRTFTTVHTAEE